MRARARAVAKLEGSPERYRDDFFTRRFCSPDESSLYGGCEIYRTENFSRLLRHANLLDEMSKLITFGHRRDRLHVINLICIIKFTSIARRGDFLRLGDA